MCWVYREVKIIEKLKFWKSFNLKGFKNNFEKLKFWKLKNLRILGVILDDLRAQRQKGLQV